MSRPPSDDLSVAGHEVAGQRPRSDHRSPALGSNASEDALQEEAELGLSNRCGLALDEKEHRLAAEALRVRRHDHGLTRFECDESSAGSNREPCCRGA